jgi:hypothetical protein
LATFFQKKEKKLNLHSKIQKIPNVLVRKSNKIRPPPPLFPPPKKLMGIVLEKPMSFFLGVGDQFWRKFGFALIYPKLCL